jgi:RNA polymerase sigma factor (sigma-70 family)
MEQTEIIQKIRENKLGKVYKDLHRAFPSIKKWVINNSGTKQDAEDVFQETLVIFCINCRKLDFKLDASIPTYLTAVAKNLWFATLRKRGKTIEFGLAETAINSNDFEILEEKYTLAEQAYNLLGEKCKQLLEKFYILRLSFEQISKDLEFSTPEVAKNQKYRCLQKAKELYTSLNLKGGETC